MIYSSIEDNWFRLEAVFKIAQNLYSKTKDSDHRLRQLTGREFFHFSVQVHDQIRSEKAIVGMVICWSAVTLEATLNHIIAEKLEHRLAATLAIETPSKFLQDFKLKIPKGNRSELALKVVIIADCLEPDTNIFTDANVIAARRNKIVHDKPDYFYQYSEDGIDYWSYSNRDNDEKSDPCYDALEEHFTRCDRVLSYLERFHRIEDVNSRRFASLFET